MFRAPRSWWLRYLLQPSGRPRPLLHHCLQLLRGDQRGEPGSGPKGHAGSAPGAAAAWSVEKVPLHTPLRHSERSIVFRQNYRNHDEIFFSHLFSCGTWLEWFNSTMLSVDYYCCKLFFFFCFSIKRGLDYVLHLMCTPTSAMVWCFKKLPVKITASCCQKCLKTIFFCSVTHLLWTRREKLIVRPDTLMSLSRVSKGAGGVLVRLCTGEC